MTPKIWGRGRLIITLQVDVMVISRGLRFGHQLAAVGMDGKLWLWSAPFWRPMQKGEHVLPIMETEKAEGRAQAVPILYARTELRAAPLIRQVC